MSRWSGIFCNASGNALPARRYRKVSNFEWQSNTIADVISPSAPVPSIVYTRCSLMAANVGAADRMCDTRVVQDGLRTYCIIFMLAFGQSARSGQQLLVPITVSAATLELLKHVNVLDSCSRNNSQDRTLRRQYHSLGYVSDAPLQRVHQSRTANACGANGPVPHGLLTLTRTLVLFAADIISAVEFDQTGQHLATGDRGGRVVLFERLSGPQVRCTARRGDQD